MVYTRTFRPCKLALVVEVMSGETKRERRVLPEKDNKHKKAVRFKSNLTQTKVIARKPPAYCHCDDIGDAYTKMLACDGCQSWHSFQCVNYTPKQTQKSSPPSKEKAETLYFCLDCRKGTLLSQTVARLKQKKAPTYDEAFRLCDKLGLQTSGDVNDLVVRLICFLSTRPSDRWSELCKSHGKEAQLADLRLLESEEFSSLLGQCGLESSSGKIKEKLIRLHAFLAGKDPDLALLDEPESPDKENSKPRQRKKKSPVQWRVKASPPTPETKTEEIKKKSKQQKATKNEAGDDFELLDAFSLEQLRKESRTCGLEATGTKKQLKERLTAHLTKELQEKSKIPTGTCTCSGIRNCDYCMATLIDGLIV